MARLIGGPLDGKEVGRVSASLSVLQLPLPPAPAGMWSTVGACCRKPEVVRYERHVAAFPDPVRWRYFEFDLWVWEGLRVNDLDPRQLIPRGQSPDRWRDLNGNVGTL